jgi:hypothetical protein
MQSEMTIDLYTPELSRFPVLKMFFESLKDRKLEADFYPTQGGIEMRLLNEVKGMPNRAHLRVFLPNDTKCVLFFHKKSSIPFSRDRFSYGGIVIDSRSTGRFDTTDVSEWIDFLESGFQPGLRPKTIKKSFPYTIPED